MSSVDVRDRENCETVTKDGFWRERTVANGRLPSMSRGRWAIPPCEKRGGVEEYPPGGS